MKQSELQSLLTEFAAERVAILQRHEAGARVVSHYDFNNTYQYVIAREETHLQWVHTALAEYGAALPGPVATYDVPAVSAGKGKKIEPSAYREILVDDAGRLAAFVAKWRPRVQDMEHVRHRRMLEVVLGETSEHQRLFEQAAEGFEDVLGRRTGGVGRVGGVLPTRWVGTR